MELVIGENTYITVEECETILSDYFGENSHEAKVFSELSEGDKGTAVYRSFIDMQRLPYRGMKKNKDQTAMFPRVNKFGYESDEKMVKLAQALNTTVFVPNNTSTDSNSMDKILSYGKLGLKKYELGSFAITMDTDVASSASGNSKSGLVESVLVDWFKGGVSII